MKTRRVKRQQNPAFFGGLAALPASFCGDGEGVRADDAFELLLAADPGVAGAGDLLGAGEAGAALLLALLLPSDGRDGAGAATLKENTISGMKSDRKGRLYLTLKWACFSQLPQATK